MLRDERDGVLPETTGASKLNKSDVFFGDGTIISREVCVCVRACACVCVRVRVYVCACKRKEREKQRCLHAQHIMLVSSRGGGLGSSTIFKKFNEPYAPS